MEADPQMQYVKNAKNCIFGSISKGTPSYHVISYYTTPEPVLDLGLYWTDSVSYEI